MSMRVCIFSPAYLPLIGGAEIAVHEVTRRLPDISFDLFTARIQPALARFEDIGNVHVNRIGTGKDFDKKLLALHGSFYARESHRKNPYDLVWSIMASYGGFAALSFKQHERSVPFLLTLQEGDSEEHILKKVWGFTWRFKQIFKEANALHSISHSLEKWGMHMGFSGKQKQVIPNGVDLDLFTRRITLEERRLLRSSLNIGDEEKVIMSVSRLVEKNGMHDLVSACAGLTPDAHLILIGDGALRASIEDMVQSLNIAGRVHLLGTKTHEEIARWLHAADIFCRPSLSEGFGNAFIEAFAAGVPVVATRVGGIADFIDNEVNALVVPPSNPSALTHALTRVMRDAALCASLAAGGSTTAKQYSWDTVAAAMGAFMQLIIRS